MSKNPLSALSYTNKDFQTIYPELLDLVKKLTLKWDPSISNESDPGVILLKLDALIADKNNYNIDKNILEAFPETVTQEVNARNLYKQLAYHMPWYKSATMKIMFKWIGEDIASGSSVTIPKYTMVTDESSSVIYTILNDVVFNSDELVVTVDAIEGTLVNHTVNFSPVVDLVSLDHNNRIYLDSYSVAENGVYITNEDDVKLWTAVDNLAIKTLGNTYYEFGVDSRNSVCYLEFPEDIDTLIRSGLNIKYIVSSGLSGNVAARVIDRFYEEVSVTVNGNPVTLSSDVVSLYNPSASTDGADPQSISDAYRSYKKTAGTFDTLVTLRDYINAIYNSGLVSNVNVCDRLNDPQSSYKVVTEDIVSPLYTYRTNNSDNVVSYRRCNDPKNYSGQLFLYTSTNGMTLVDSVEDDVDSYYTLWSDNSTEDMTAFDLRMYLLHTPGAISTIDHYESTFDVEKSDSVVAKMVEGYILDQKCIQHDFKDIIPNRPFMYKNSYPLGIKIVPQSFLTTAQQDAVKVNIVKALWEVCNSRAVDFGAAPDYDLIYDTIQNADERIKVVILDDFQYTTFATYWDGKQFKDVPVSVSDSDLVVEVNSYRDLINIKTRWLADKQSSKLNKAYFIALSTIYEDDVPYTPGDEDKRGWIADKGDVIRYNESKKAFESYSNLRDKFRHDIVAKSILAGKTPLYTQTSTFDYTLDQKYADSVTTDRVTTHAIIAPFSGGTKGLTDDNKAITESALNKIDSENAESSERDELKKVITEFKQTDDVVAEYKLQANESIRLLAPSFTSSKSYSNYVKFILHIKDTSGKTRREVADIEDLNGEDIFFIREDSFQVVYDRSKLRYTNLVKNFNTNIASYQSFCKEMYEGQIQAGKTPDDALMYVKDNASSSHLRSLWDVCSTHVESCCKFSSVTYDDDAQAFIDLKNSDVTFDSLTTLKVSNGSPVFESTSVSNGFVFGYIISTDISTKQWTPESGETGFYKGMFSETLNRDMTEFIVDSNDIVYSAFQDRSISVYFDKTVYTIDSDTDYQLRDGEYIAFFYRTEDADDAPYIAEVYKGISAANTTSTKKSPIIRSNFTMYANNVDEFDINKVPSSKEIPYGSDLFNIIAPLYGDNDLSGSKEINIREMNQVILESGKNKYYFITNTYSDEDEDGVYDHYAMHFEKKAQSTADRDGKITCEYRYTLKTDEYFIYTNSEMTEFEMLGAGTLIGLQLPFYNEKDIGSVYTDTVTKISYIDIMQQGITAFSDHCKKLDNDTTLFCREQQIYNIVEKDTVQLKMTNETAFTTANPDFNKRPYFCSWMDTIVEGFSVSYKTSSGQNVNIPELDIENDIDCKWVGRAYMNLNCSLDDAQSIVGYNNSKDGESNAVTTDYYSSQFIVYSEDGKTSVQPQNNATVKLNSSVLLNKVGGSNIDISYLDGFGDTRNTDLYMYSTNDNLSSAPFTKKSDSSIVLTFKDMSSASVETDITLESNSLYILPISVTIDTEGVNVQLQGKSEDSYEVLSTLVNTTELTSGNHYFLIDTTSNSNVVTKLKFTVEGERKAGDILTIKPLVKVTQNEDLYKYYGFNSDDILGWVNALDVEGKFNYAHIVSDDELVDKPLHGASFFDSNHVCNPYTIAKAETRMNSTTGSYTTIINNR